MTTLDQPELVFPSAPIEGETRAVVESVGNDWRADDDWRRFVAACEEVTLWDGVVDPSLVRAVLTRDGELTIAPRRLSAFYNRATGKSGFLVFSHWGISTDVKGRNQGKPCKIYELRATA